MALITDDNDNLVPVGDLSREALLVKALNEIHRYVDASDQELLDDGVTREEVLSSARKLREQAQPDLANQVGAGNH